jgi:AraC family transcriptional regulator of adaptative response / DNA-3-methyladenine glycosylase II
VAVPGPFAGAALLDFLLRHALAGVEWGGVGPDGSVRYARTLGLAHGPATLDLGWADGRLELVLDADPRDHADAVRRVAHLVDSAADPESVDAHLARDPALAGLVAATPGCGCPGCSTRPRCWSGRWSGSRSRWPPRGPTAHGSANASGRPRDRDGQN